LLIMGTMLVLCGIGLYASAFMASKAAGAARGEISEPSVVQSPRARFFGVSSGLVGAAYYAALALTLPFLDRPAVWTLALAAAIAAALASLYLAYSLLFVTRRPCVYCWTSHVANWLLVVLLLLEKNLAG